MQVGSPSWWQCWSKIVILVDKLCNFVAKISYHFFRTPTHNSNLIGHLLGDSPFYSSIFSRDFHCCAFLGYVPLFPRLESSWCETFQDRGLAKKAMPNGKQTTFFIIFYDKCLFALEKKDLSVTAILESPQDLFCSGVSSAIFLSDKWLQEHAIPLLFRNNLLANCWPDIRFCQVHKGTKQIDFFKKCS